MCRILETVAGVLFLMSIQFYIVTCFQCRQRLQASSYPRSISTSYLTGKVNCSWRIYPSAALGKTYYLEVKWNRFAALSPMPSCDGDHVAIYITRKRHSLGKFCTGGMHHLPFNILSYDGYALIQFSLSLSDGAYLSMSYLIRKRSQYATCNAASIGPSSYTGIVSSKGWPSAIKPSICSYSITTMKNVMTKIVVMDFDIASDKQRCHFGNEYVEITAWQLSDGVREKVYLLERSCSDREPFSIETIYTEIHVEIAMYSTRGKQRGFQAGILKYSLPVKRKPFPVIAVAVGGSVAGIVIIALVVGIVLCIAKVRKKRATRPTLNSVPSIRTMIPPARRNTLQPVIHPVEMAELPQAYTWKEVPFATNYPPPNEAPPAYAEVFAIPSPNISSNAYITAPSPSQ